ncbi:uncharacterized protein RHOBADRAFT_14367 [Rhodotorula graminis WP1]|uniref:ATP-dependent DNA helicase CHL1 n=1 Tax=Rhodotorula graminis (strain WP1) TaxID=578459 RepID=A0A194S3X9_RHOGW|nr:uncharacterized protein RHOBADRAFT_14367 [Rhodotorula graminis WP1]KPV75443.1 hypothetical protein RHOBADRAFT_14367 [Rhodotorula graminis WP1]
MAFEPSDPTYGFPYDAPYDVQKQLMDHLYRSFAASQVTVVESPTGTGKSLSLISSSLSFLRDAKAHARHDLVASIREHVASSDSMKDEPAWVIEHEIKSKLDELDRQERDLEERLRAIREREKKERVRAAQEQGRTLAKKRLVCPLLPERLQVHQLPRPAHSYLVLPQKIAADEPLDDNDDQFAPTPYFEDGDTSTTADELAQSEDDNYSPAIFFASRTHSQLSQFVAELRKTRFAREDDSLASRPVRIIPLGSRQTLCINDDVRRKSGGSNEAMGDLCTELQKGGKDRCEFLPPSSEPARLNDFRDKALASVRDIEDIEELGRKTHTCPYYGSRKAVRAAEVVTLPYNLLMQRSAREALGISLKDHIIIIDEAHNLIDSILSLHSVSTTTSQLIVIRQALLVYIQKFRSRFTGLNATYLKQLALLLKGLSEFAETWAKRGKKEEMVQVAEVFARGGSTTLDQINLRKLDEYLQKSKIARKIGGYVDSVAEEKTASAAVAAGRQAVRANATRALQHIQQLILSLANASRDGRVLLSQSTKPAGKDGVEGKVEITLKYMLLAPADSFRDVAEEARAVVLAGGTMAPMSDFREQLFPYLAPERFSTFSCGHVVPKEHVSTFAVTKGPTGIPFNFTFERRKDERLLDELGQAIVNISAVVPKGVVVFVPSYDFLHHAQARWEKSGMIKRLSAKKQTFWEPKASADVDLVLREFAAGNAGDAKVRPSALPSTSLLGSILFAVVGAKLSEGINFADDMARGIPYPNSQSAELKERMAYLKSAGQARRVAGAPDAGQVLYQNLAFRAVNQSIGRAIRSARDWASIILLDERYAQPAKKAQLPHWLGDDVQSPPTFGALIQGVARFSRERRTAQVQG